MQRFDTMTRTIYAPDQPPSFLARWASRLALFFAVVLPIALFMHRLFGLPTPVALNIAAACFAGAALVLLMAAVAGLDIWVTGRQGAARIVVATVLAAALLSVPLSLYVIGRKWPPINDVTTDLSNPPQFVNAYKTRSPGSNPLEYPARFAPMQQASYPDLKTLVVPRTAEETFELVHQALAKQKLTPDYEVPPNDDDGTPGIVEIADRTMILGFTDDVVIRVADDDGRSRVDVRSASRYGISDFGQNAERVRVLLKEIAGRVTASVPNAEASARAQRKKDAKAAAAKQLPNDSPKSGRKPPSKRDPSRSGTRRAPERKASPQE